MTALSHWEGEPVGVWARIWGIPIFEAHDTLGSTNDRARELLLEGAPPWTTVVAEEQTAGRGRDRKVWHSPAATGLWMSLLLPDGGEPGGATPLLVGLAAARALEEVVEGITVGVKWPNDLLVDGRKVAGILCEGMQGGVVAGIGVNVWRVPDDLPEAVAAASTSVTEVVGTPASRSSLAGALVRQLRALPVSGRGVLPRELRSDLARRDVLRDRTVSTARGEGIARGIDAHGALLLEGPEGQRARVVAGSVRLVNAPTSRRGT